MKRTIFRLFATVVAMTSLDAFASGLVQKRPKVVNSEITVVGTTYGDAMKYADAAIEVPSETKPGDMMIFYIGGSYAGNEKPGDPVPSKGWTEIEEIGPADLNLKAFYKKYEEGDRTEYNVKRGKSKFVSIVSVRGINDDCPVVDSKAQADTQRGSSGRATAPSVRGEDDGMVFATYVYDDPHEAKVTSRGFDMILSARTKTGDGMAVAVAKTEDGQVGSIDATGRSSEPGGGNDIAMAISFRPASHKCSGKKRDELMIKSAPQKELVQNKSAESRTPSLRGTAKLLCGESKEPFVVGKEFCYTKTNADGFAVQIVRTCDYFGKDSKDARLRNSCNDSNLGARSCPACEAYLQ